jgi:aryl-alcohol dehydrogenase-like predicted oxidoreductase
VIYENFRGYQISKLALGTVQFGLNYGIANKIGKPSQVSINEILNFTKHNGINTLDTAQAYGNSEIILGNYSVFDFNVISKISSDKLKPEYIKESLDKLKIYKLFGLLMHDSKLLYNWTELETRLLENIKKYTIFFGVSIYSSQDFDIALNNPNIDIIQIPFNLFDHRAIKEHWFKRAKDKNKFIFIRSIYLQGLFFLNSQDIKIEALKPYLNQLSLIADKFKIEKHVLAMSFIKTFSQNSSILFGCETLEQAKENIDIFNKALELGSEQIKEISIFSNLSEDIYNPSRWNK